MDDIEKHIALTWLQLFEKNLMCGYVADDIGKTMEYLNSWSVKYVRRVLRKDEVLKEVLTAIRFDIMQLLHGASPLTMNSTTQFILDYAKITNLFLTEEDKYEHG